MKKSYLILLASFALQSLFASDLATSLIDVNRFWAYESQALQQVLDRECVPDQSNLIQLHLNLVHEELSSRDVSHLTEEQRMNRFRALGHLKYYAERGLFPKNLTHRIRRPVFIDHRGVHCAVGYLISACGNPDLSKKISANMNTHYLKEMQDEELNSWVASSGFTLNELAWIQPGYPFPVNWDQLKGGTNGPVFCLEPTDLGGLYAGGWFDTAGGYQALNAAHYFSGFAGFDWMNLNGGANGPVYDILTHNNEIYMAGAFYAVDTVITSSSIVKWDGSGWQSLGGFYVGGMFSFVNDLVMYRDTLYAGGLFRSDIGASQFFANLAKWNGQEWVRAFKDTSSFSYVQGEVRALEVYNNKLIVAGNFQLADSSMSRNIFAINGNEIELFGEDLEVPVNDLEVYEGELYAASSYLHPSTLDTAGLMRWRNQKWERLLDDFTYPAKTDFKSLQATPEGLVFGGDFDIFSMISIGKNIGGLVAGPGKADQFYVLGILDSSVNALAYKDDNLYAGGYFNLGFNTPIANLGHVTRIKLSDYLSKREYALRNFKIYPNPASDEVNLSVPEDLKGVQISVYDMSGKRISIPFESIGKNTYNISTGHLAPGRYILWVEAGGYQHSEKLIIDRH